MVEYALEALGLSKQYGQRQAVVSVDLRVRPGEVHGLVGVNGAGKTTLLRMLLGLVRPDAGVVRLLGHEVRHGSMIPAAVAGLIDSPRFYPYLSGRRNLDLLARLDAGEAGPQRASRVDQVLEQVHLQAHAHVDVGAYSAGARQRLGLAAALLRSPRLLLLDEPTSALDPAGARELRGLIGRLVADGCAVLMSSHDMTEVEQTCRTLTVMHRGGAVFTGAIEPLRERTSVVHRLRTSADERAMAVAADHAGVCVSADTGGLSVVGGQADRDEFFIALGGARIAIRSLELQVPMLERVVVDLTRVPAEGSDQDRAPEATESNAVSCNPVSSNPVSSNPVSSKSVSFNAGPSRRGAPRPRAVLAVAGVECTKLTSQPKFWLVLAACVLAPLGFAIAMTVQDSLPEDTLFGRWVTSSGFAVPLVVLGFAASWVFPVLTTIVSGDLFSSEDRLGTWPSLLTRSRSREELFAGKVLAGLAFNLLATAVLAVTSAAAGALLIGRQPLVGLTGSLIAPGRALALTAAAWASALPAAFAFSALAMLLSVATRSGVAGVGVPVLFGLATELIALISVTDGLRPFLIGSGFSGWHGLFAEPSFHGPLVHGVVVSAAYFVGCLWAARVILLRRDMGV